MTAHDDILSQASEESLLNTVASIPNFDIKSISTSLVKLHNSGKLDILSAYQSKNMDPTLNDKFWDLYRVFCETLPSITCSVIDATRTCKVLHEKAGRDIASGQVYSALDSWFHKDRDRCEECLTLIQNNIDFHAHVTACVLLAIAKHDLTRSAELALSLSRHQEQSIRLESLHALGQMSIKGNQRVLEQTFVRFEEVIDSPPSDEEASVVIHASLSQFDRIGGSLVDKVVPLLRKSSNNPTPNMIHAIAVSLLQSGTRYTDEMLDLSFSIIQCVKSEHRGTLRMIDSVLDQWDTDGDRERILKLLCSLLRSGDNPIEFNELTNFVKSISTGPGEVAAWYVVSLLLTGDHRKCVAATQLLPDKQISDGLDINLTPFALDSKWVMFLAQKILGYCLSRSKSAAALLFSCIRQVPKTDRSELEELIFRYLLINYPTTLDCLIALVSENDSARDSIERLSVKLKSYHDALRQNGHCVAFRPSEHQFHLQRRRQEDYFRGIFRDAFRQSEFLHLIPMETTLYGTQTIVYEYASEGNARRRQERSFAHLEQVVEIPSLDIIDPIGFRYAIRCFQSKQQPS